MTDQSQVPDRSQAQVWVNGTTLSDEQLAELEGGYGARPLPGEYWYAQSGGMGGGDNIWSSRFGAGNSDSGGQRGYVSVPGHGPIGYGF